MQSHKTTFVYRHCSHLYFPKMKQSLHLTKLISGGGERKEKGVLQRWHRSFGETSRLRSASEVVTDSIVSSPALRENVNHRVSAIFVFFPLPPNIMAGA